MVIPFTHSVIDIFIFQMHMLTSLRKLTSEDDLYLFSYVCKREKGSFMISLTSSSSPLHQKK